MIINTRCPYSVQLLTPTYSGTFPISNEYIPDSIDLKVNSAIKKFNNTELYLVSIVVKLDATLKAKETLSPIKKQDDIHINIQTDFLISAKGSREDSYSKKDKELLAEMYQIACYNAIAQFNRLRKDSFKEDGLSVLTVNEILNDIENGKTSLPNWD